METARAYRESVVQFEGASRVHVGLEVTDLSRSVAFYRALLGEGPVKVRPGYAKFEPREPALNLALVERPGGPAERAAGSRHYGVQVKSSRAVDALAARLTAARVAVREERGVTCCYAVQDKVWASDPDRNPWEVFVVVGEDPERCCGPDAEAEPGVERAAGPAAAGVPASDPAASGAAPGGACCGGA